MDRLKKKIGFILFASILAFATTFGVGVSALSTYFSSPSYAIAETEEENVGATSDEVGAMANVDKAISGEYITTKPPFDGYNTIEITNSLFVYDNSNMLGDLSGKTVTINNSIFVYTGSGSSDLFTNGSRVTLNNVIFYASGTGSVNNTNITTDMLVFGGGFVYGNAKDNSTTVYEQFSNESTSISRSLTDLISEVRFLAQDTYTYDLDGNGSISADEEFEIWSGSWNFSNDGWAYASSTIVDGSWTSRPTGIYPYPAQYIDNQISGTNSVKVYLYTGMPGEADNSKIVLNVGGNDTIDTQSPYTLTRNGYEHVGW